MAKTISSLQVVLGATVAPFVSAFGKVQSSVAGFSNSISSAGSSILKFTGIGAAIGALAGGAGIGMLIHQQLDAIDVNAKLSDRMGISTEALVGLQHAGDLAGISQESLSTGMGFMLKNMAKAAGGSKDVSEAFQKIGLDAKQLVNLAPDEAFLQISEAISKIDNPAQRALAAVQVFGKAGQGLLPLMMDGAAGIRAAMEEAKLLGLTYSRIDAAKVEEANDAWTRAKATVTGVFRQITIAIAPYLTMAANALTQFGIKVVASVKTYLPTVMRVLGSIWSGITSIFRSIYQTVAPIIAAIGSWIATNWQTIATVTANYWVSIYNVIAAVLGAAWSIISTVWGGIVSVWNAALSAVGANTWATNLSIIGAWSGMVDGITTALNFAAFVISHFGAIVALIGTEVILSVVTMGAQIAYVFTEVIPSLLSWLSTHWAEVFSDILNFNKVTFENMAANAQNFFAAMWSWMKGDGFNFQWTGLLEGFKSTITELPKIAERVKGPLEQGLTADLESQRAKVGQDFNDAMGQDTHFGDTLSKSFGAFKLPELSVPRPNISPFATGMDDVKDKAAMTGAAIQQSLDMVNFGSAEAQLSRYQSNWDLKTNPISVSGEGDDKTTEKLDEQTDLLDAIQTATATIATNSMPIGLLTI